ncbi:MAG: hypothetical protein M3413_01620, partial [Bacteroidota bacterium]|nr:hypothetical protein [Bacteroidota bacterium]
MAFILKFFRIFSLLIFIVYGNYSFTQGTRLLRQPDISDDKIVFAYAGDIWTTLKNGGNAIRITSTAAVEANPHFSPDGKWIAFSS